MVIVGSNWGSGIVIGHKNNRYLLTCSHVLKGSDYNTGKIYAKDVHVCWNHIVSQIIDGDYLAQCYIQL